MMNAPPKRKRRGWRWVVALIVAGAAVPIGIFWWREWQLQRQIDAVYAEIEKDDPHWRWHDLEAQRKEVDDDRNSALLILSTHQLISQPTQAEYTVIENDFSPNGLYRPETIQVLQAIAQRNEKFIEKIAKLRHMPWGRLPATPDDSPWEIQNPDIRYLRDASTILQHVVRLRSSEQKPKEAIDACIQHLNIARSFGEDRLLIDRASRSTFTSITLGEVEQALGRTQPAEADLAELQQALAAEEAESSLRNAMRGERAHVARAVEWIRAGKPLPSEAAPFSAKTPGSWMRSVEIFFKSRWELRHFIANYRYLMLRQHEFAELAKLPIEQFSEKLKELEELPETEADPILKTSILRLVKNAQAHVNVRTRLRCTIAGLAAERYRIQHQRWPKSLQELVDAKLLQSPTLDLFDGKTLRLKRTDEGIAIYSVGLDRVDNDGHFLPNMFSPGADMGFRVYDPAFRNLPLPK